MTEHSNGGYERQDVSVRAIVLAGAGLALVLAIVLLMTGMLFRFLDSQRAEVVATTVVPPEPRLEVAPEQDLQRIQATQQAVLEGYAWVDEANSIARIPISRAMEILAERGLPVRTEETGP